MKIAIQGLDTSFHAHAAKRLFGNDIELVHYATFPAVFHALHNKKVNQAVVAIENSLYGSINEVYDLLLKYKVTVTGEIYEKIGLHLLGIQGATLSDITDVYSQAPALAEAKDFLDNKLVLARRHEHSDTALAAEEVARWAKPQNAAIASRAAAEKYDLSILAENIETHHQNYTRFLVISRSDNTVKGNKSSLVFQTSDTPGSLHAALGVFARRNINITKLESRPIIGKAWQYMYYIDISSVSSPDLINELGQFAQNIHVLGNYKAGIFESIK
jgi:prephenate dehydratase